jgi:DNA-binding CsgD family transcriptional regulator
MDIIPSHLRANLTDRQIQCLLMVGAGYSSKEIARKLGISPSTVDSHISTATQILGVDDRRQAARLMMADPNDGALLHDGPRGPVRRSVFPEIPPIGGVINTLGVRARMLHVLQIALIGTIIWVP